MNFKIFINAILIILVLHLIIKNIQYKYKGVKYDERMSINKNRSINFLNNETKIENFEVDDALENNSYKELMEYVRQCSPNDVNPGNYYNVNDNTSNFSSNVLNVNKFYDIDKMGEYDGLVQPPITSYEMPYMDKTDEVKVMKEVSEQTCYPLENANDNETIFRADEWEYKNEMVMNGGKIMDGLVGFNNLEDSYAKIEEKEDKNCDVNESFSCDNNFNYAPDDLRMGLGVPNKEYRDTH